MEKFKEYAKSILIAIVLSLIVRAAIVEAYYVPTGSMLPTIVENDRLMSNKFIYWFTDPKPGDIVVFKPPVQVHTEAPRFLKRVIAVGGDRVEVKYGVVYRNRKPLIEPYIKDMPDYTMSSFIVPDGYVFVLGDNRRNSYDSHMWGFLPEKNITAKVMFRFWPITRIGIVH